MAKKSRRSVASIITQSTKKIGPRGWYEQLPIGDQEYVMAVVSAMRGEPRSHPHTVAGMLIEELGLGIRPGAVSKKLKELMNV